MYHSIRQTEIHATNVPLQRVFGAARVGFRNRGGATRLADLYQSGSAKVRLPRIYTGAPTAVLINTAGGLTGGDRLNYDIVLSGGTHAIVTTQAAERAYRSPAGTARIDVGLTAGNGSTLEWLPQETILFDRSALRRRITADLTGSARLLAMESVVIGRPAMGEIIEYLEFGDRWRVRRDGKLVFAEDVRILGDPAEALSGKAAADGHTAFAGLVDCSMDAVDRLPRARAALDAAKAARPVTAAASARDGVLTVRFVASDGRNLRDGLMAFLHHYRAAELPRVWRC